MTAKEKKAYREKLFEEEVSFLPHLTKEKKIYKTTANIWIVFSFVYMAVTEILLLYMGRIDLTVASLAIPLAALFCVYFINSGMKGMTVITVIGGAFEVFRGYLMFTVYEPRLGRVWMAYVIIVIIQGAVTLSISLFITVSPKIGHYLSVMKKINNRIMLGR